MDCEEFEIIWRRKWYMDRQTDFNRIKRFRSLSCTCWLNVMCQECTCELLLVIELNSSSMTVSVWGRGLDVLSEVSSLSHQDTKMELPLWLSKGLYERKRRVLSVELPKVYKEGWRTVFNADPNVVDLHKMGPYYYGLGSQMLHFDSPENPDIAQTLLQVTVTRTPHRWHWYQAVQLSSQVYLSNHLQVINIQIRLPGSTLHIIYTDLFPSSRTEHDSAN